MLDDHIHKLIATKVVAAVRGAIQKVSRSSSTTMIELFDVWYATVSEAAIVAAMAVVSAIGVQGRGSCKYRDFSNTKPLEFDGVKDPIMSMIWISDVEGYFFTCSCPKDWKFSCAMKLLLLGTKD